MYRTAGCILFSHDDMTSASRSVGVLEGGANWGCYGPSLVPVLPQPPGGAEHPPAPPTLRPWHTSGADGIEFSSKTCHISFPTVEYNETTALGRIEVPTTS